MWYIVSLIKGSIHVGMTKNNPSLCDQYFAVPGLSCFFAESCPKTNTCLEAGKSEMFVCHVHNIADPSPFFFFFFVYNFQSHAFSIIKISLPKINTNFFFHQILESCAKIWELLIILCFNQWTPNDVNTLVTFSINWAFIYFFCTFVD